MTAFGVSPLGTDLGPAGGPGLITVLGVLAASNNSFVVVFDRVPRQFDTENVASGINHTNYTLAAVDPRITAGNGDVVVPRGEVVPTISPAAVAAVASTLDPTQIEVFTDAPMERGVRYRVTVSDAIESVDDDVFAGPTEFEFRGLGTGRVVADVQQTEERYRDFDYAQSPSDVSVSGLVGIYNVDSSGDIAIQDQTASLRKRILRRITSQPGEWAHAPSYGVASRVKSLAKAGDIQRLANEIQSQIRQEPDVLEASATVRLDRRVTGTFVLVDAFVQQRDQRERRLLFDVPIQL